MTPEGWESRHPRAWSLAELVAAVLVIGSALAVGIALPLLLPVAIAGATRVAARRARRAASDPLPDFVAGIREDTVRVALALLLVAVPAAPAAWALALGPPPDGGLIAGVRLGMSLWLALLLPLGLVGVILAVATTTPMRAIPVAALAVLAASPVRILFAGVIASLAIIPSFAGFDPASVVVLAGTGGLGAVHLAWSGLRPVAARSTVTQ